MIMITDSELKKKSNAHDREEVMHDLMVLAKLREAEIEAETSDVRYTHAEVMEKVRTHLAEMTGDDRRMHGT